MRLHDAIALAVATNPALATSTLALDGADAARDADRARYEARFEAKASGHAERSQPRRSPFTELLARDTYAVSASIVRPLFDGGEARIAVVTQRETTTSRLVDSTSGVHGDLDQRSIIPRLEVSVREPLWGGRRTGAAVRDRLAAERDATALAREGTAARVLRDVEHAYWQLYLAQQEVAIRHDATVAADSQLQQVSAEIARGSRPRLAALEIEEELARRREDELIATGNIGERSLELARLLGIQPTDELRATDPTPADLEPVEVELDHAPDLRAAAARVDAASSRLTEARDATRWQIDAQLAGSLSAPRDRWREAIDDTAGYGGWTIDAALTLRAPLSGRARRAALAGARAKLFAARVDQTDAAAELATEVVRQTNRRDLARQRRVALQRARELAGENLAAERNRWDRGDTTAYEVLRRQAAVSEARLRFERARIDELDATIALSALAGELPARHGITLR